MCTVFSLTMLKYPIPPSNPQPWDQLLKNSVKIPIKSKSTLSQLTISTTNIQGLGVGTPKGDRKCTTILGLKTTISIIIDAHTDSHKLNMLKSRMRRKLSKYDIIGHDSRLRGILVLVEKLSGI